MSDGNALYSSSRYAFYLPPAYPICKSTKNIHPWVLIWLPSVCAYVHIHIQVTGTWASIFCSPNCHWMSTCLLCARHCVRQYIIHSCKKCFMGRPGQIRAHKHNYKNRQGLCALSVLYTTQVRNVCFPIPSVHNILLEKLLFGHFSHLVQSPPLGIFIQTHKVPVLLTPSLVPKSLKSDGSKLIESYFSCISWQGPHYHR